MSTFTLTDDQHSAAMTALMQARGIVGCIIEGDGSAKDNAIWATHDLLRKAEQVLDAATHIPNGSTQG